MSREIPGFYFGMSPMLLCEPRLKFTPSISHSLSQPNAKLISPQDPEKNKYFKIQPNHVAPPGSQYSTESVKRKRAEKEVSTHGPSIEAHADTIQDESKKAQLQQRRAKETVRKESFLHHPLISVGQEIGARISPISRLDKYSRAYASQMRRVKLHKFNPWANTSLSVGKVLRSPRSGLLVAGNCPIFILIEQ